MTDKEREDLNEAKREARNFLRAYAATCGNEEVKTAIHTAIGAGSRGTRTVASSIDLLKEALIEAGEEGLSEMDVFMQFKIGRPEMTIKCRNLVKTKDPSDRVWVQFDSDLEKYFVVGEGAEMPEDWQGYIPAEYATL